jgi:toxin HigB-1
VRIADRGTQDIFDGRDSAAARRTVPSDLHARAAGLLDRISAAHSLQDLRSPPGNHLEKLGGPRIDQHSLRINDQYRICFRWEQGQAQDVEITDYH